MSSRRDLCPAWARGLVALVAVVATLGIAPVGSAAASAQDPVVGEVRNWLASDRVYGFSYPKQFTLRGFGEHIEVWVASEMDVRAPARSWLPQVGQSSAISYLDGDCRNGPRTEITDAQVNDLIDEFDNNIFPTESAVFGVPPERDGTKTTLPDFFNPRGEGDNLVVLVDNIRDENFYDFDNSQRLFDIGGSFSSQMTELFDRNVLTLEGFDWLHRLGADPPHDPVPDDPCTSATGFPRYVEGVTAHEYQHLLQYYEDGDEFTWVREGLAQWAMTMTGYQDPTTPFTELGSTGGIQCFLGWAGLPTPANPDPFPGGPENSLTRWADQPGDHLLCDYGAAQSFMEFLAGRYGPEFMGLLNRDDANGLAGVQDVLRQVSSRLDVEDVLHDWSLMVALDGLIDDGAKTSGSPREAEVTTPTLHATVNWDSADAYSTPGAPPNGADYVRLRDASGTYLDGRHVRSLGFTGATTFPTSPVQWAVDGDPPFQPGDPALYAGAADRRDEAIVHPVAVPPGADAELSFDALWNEEENFDYGFVQVSTDGGATYASIACTDTTEEVHPQAGPTAIANVPGFTGFSGEWRPQTCSLSAYAGQSVLLAFRAYNDEFVLGTEPSVASGFWVDAVSVGGTLIADGTSLAGWQSFTETRPVPVAGFSVHLISVRTASAKITVRRLPLTGDFNLEGRASLERYIDRQADFVAAVVFHHDPTETITQYAPYRLTVNGVTQPGGGP